MKSIVLHRRNNTRWSRHPYGWRGLKYRKGHHAPIPAASPPVWVAWIEILARTHTSAGAGSPPVWVAWIEIEFKAISDLDRASPPVWVAWIEIQETADDVCQL